MSKPIRWRRAGQETGGRPTAWAPGRAWFAVTAALLLAPFLFVSHLLWKTTTEQIDFGRRELVGTEYVERASAFLYALERYRLLAFRLGGTDGELLAAAHRAAEEALAALEATGQRSPLLPSQQLAELREAWETAARTPASGTRATYYASIATLAVNLLRDEIATASNLILDPNRTTYWLIEVEVSKLPVLMDTLARSGVAVSSAVGPEHDRAMEIAADAKRLLDDIGDLESVDLREAFESASQHGETERLPRSVGSAYQALAATVRAHASTLETAWPSAPPSDTMLALPGLDRAAALSDAIVPEVRRLVQARIAKYEMERVFGVAGAALAALILVDLYVVFWLSVRRAERERLDLIHRLEVAVGARDDFISVAAHELRSPLTTLYLQVETLARDRAELEPRRVDLMKRQVQRLTTFIDELLDVSQITSGKLRMHFEDNVDLSAIVREIADRLREEFAHAGCELVVRARQQGTGRWDRFRLEQVVANLLSNALKYGAGKPVEVEVAGEDDHVRLRVMDHGIGIVPEKRETIFERFERAVPEDKFRGLGLGLWIVREIVEAMHGDIRVESEVGRGSTFEVSLPR